jgi:hypothetical protein
LSTHTDLLARLKNSAGFSKIHQIPADSLQTEFKTDDLLFTNSKFRKIIKNQETICKKKLDRILKWLEKKVFENGNVWLGKI